LPTLSVTFLPKNIKIHSCASNAHDAKYEVRVIAGVENRKAEMTGVVWPVDLTGMAVVASVWL